MKRAILIGLLAYIVVVLALVVFALPGQAKVGLALGPSFGWSNPLTPHIGPVYYKAGDRATAAIQSKAEHAPTELDQFIQSEKRLAMKLKCAKLHAQYISRHGFTTPQPLKGMGGCAKYARDQAYWETRRGQRQSLTGPKNQIVYTIHDSAFSW